MKTLVLLVGTLLAGCLVTSAAAQFTQRSSISGLVTDTTKAVIPNVTVVLRDQDRNQTVKASTDEAGFYSFANLIAGRYRVEAEHSGFKKAISETVAVGAQTALRVDIALEVGAVSDSVEVKSGAAPLLQTDQMAVGQIVDRGYIQDLPVGPGRSISSVLALAPNVSTFPLSNIEYRYTVGVNDTTGATRILPGGGGDSGFFMNGVNINASSFTQDMNYQPSMEAIAEVKLDVVGFSAANGRDIVVSNMQTRGGTRQLHGTGFEYFQNGVLNGWNPYLKSRATPNQGKPFLQKNQFGGNLGGPVVLPKVFNGRDKAFFFVNYERTRLNQGSVASYARVPTAAERLGDFSSLLRRFPGDPNYVLYDPYSTAFDARGNSVRTSIPNNDLRATGRINPSAQAMLGAFPMPNGYQNPANPNDLANYAYTEKTDTSNFRLDSRFDYRLTASDSLFVAFSRSQGTGGNKVGGVFPEIGRDRSSTGQVLAVNYARVFTSNMTNEFIFGHGFGGQDNLSPPIRAYMQKPDTIFNKYLQNLGTPKNFGFHSINISGYPVWGVPEVQDFNTPVLQFSDNLIWIKGRHSLKFGANYIGKGHETNNIFRTAAFNKTFTSAGGAGSYRGGDALASFVFGLPASMTVPFAFENDAVPTRKYNTPSWGFYMEDKWQVNPKLTVTLGLRHELPIQTYAVERFGLAVMDYSYPGGQLAVPGIAPALPQRNIPAAKKDFAPRVGLAYRFRNHFVARASYGIFYDCGGLEMFSVSDGTDNVAGTQGEIYNNARYNVHDDTPYLTFQNVFPRQIQVKLGTYPVSTGPGTGYFTSITNVFYRDNQSNVTPYYQRWALDLQKSLGANTSLTVSYVGGRGTRLAYKDDINRAAYRTGWASTAAYNAARPNRNGRFAEMRVFRHGHNSFYQSGTVKLQRNLSKGFQLTANYTFSKTVMDRPFGTDDIPGVKWDWNRSLGRGEADFSHPHRLVTALSYDTPWGKGLPAFPKSVLAGWKLAVLATFESGDAITVLNGQTSARDREPEMPNVSCNPNLPRGDRTTSQYFNTSCFSAPLQDVKGNAGLGIVRAPGLNNWNLSVSKSFKPRPTHSPEWVERLTVQFRADMYNAFNHSQWYGVNRTFSEARGNTFGWVTGARDGRIIQVALRVLF